VQILVVKLSSIGDLVHTLPAVAAIRRALPDAAISWVAERRSAEILRGSPIIDNLIEIDTRSIRGSSLGEILPEIKRQARFVRSRKYDIAIDFQGLLKSAAITRLSGAKRRWGFGKEDLREGASRFLYTDAVAVPSRTHVIRKNLWLASRSLEFQLDETAVLEFPIATDDGHRQEAAEIIERAGENFVILNPAGGWETKLWHPEKYGRLAEQLRARTGMVSVVVTGPNESELAQTVERTAAKGSVVLAEPSLKGFYELARHTRAYVGGDTGPTHIAVAAGAPVVALFGPTEWWRNGSLAPADIVIERDDISCRVECHRRTCSQWICMDTEVDAVTAAVIARTQHHTVPIA
jgi:heptosyltransferase I